MKKALRERAMRPSDDHATADTHGSSSSVHAKTTAAETASASSHNSSSVYSRNSLPPGNVISSASSDLSVPGGLVGQRWVAWTGSQHLHAGAGSSDRSSVPGSLSSSSSHAADSSYLTRHQRPTAATRHFDMRQHAATTTSSHVHAPTANNH